MRLFCHSWPKEKKEQNITLLHGMGGTGKLWRPIAVGLESVFQVIAPDQRGHGQSQVADLTTYTSLEFGRDLNETLEELSVPSSWLVGHSMGVRTALAAASIDPKRYRGLILVDLTLQSSKLDPISHHLKSFLSELPEEFENRTDAKETLLKSCPDPAIAQYLLAVLEKKESGFGFPFLRETLLKIIDSATPESTPLESWAQTYLNAPDTKILLLRGDESRVYSREDFEADQEHFSQFENFEAENWPECGHGLPFEKRKEFIARVLSFTGLSLD